jgi:hypothetical protein
MSKRLPKGPVLVIHDWRDIGKIGTLDSQSRFYPHTDIGTDGKMHPAGAYIQQGKYREPSAKYPQTYLRPLLAQKFARWARRHYPEWSEHVGLFPTDPTQRALLELLETDQ